MRDFDAVMGIVQQDKSAQMVDARSASRFTGDEAEPRAGVRVRPHAGRGQCALARPGDAGRHAEAEPRPCSALSQKGVDLRAPIVTTCGSGISAAILMLALDEIGAEECGAV